MKLNVLIPASLIWLRKKMIFLFNFTNLLLLFLAPCFCRFSSHGYYHWNLFLIFDLLGVQSEIYSYAFFTFQGLYNWAWINKVPLCFNITLYEVWANLKSSHLQLDWVLHYANDRACFYECKRANHHYNILVIVSRVLHQYPAIL